MGLASSSQRRAAWEVPVIEGFNGDDENGVRCITMITTLTLSYRR